MKIIIINGPCGVGKSTVSEKLHESMPLSFLLDIDRQRRFVSQRRKYRKESGEIALAVANSILETCLRLGRDVIIDKMIFDQAVLTSYYGMAKKYNAKICEIILWAPKDVIAQRADERGYIDEIGAFTPEKCEYFWDEIDKMKDLRTQAYIINTATLTEKDVLIKITSIIKNDI